MKNKNKIINELYEKSPDVRERIRKDVDFSQFEKKNAPAAKSSNGFKWATAVLSVALIAMIAVLAPIIAKTSKPKSYASDYVVFIDVNPSVRLDVSGGDVVTAQKGMNEDGMILLYKENLVGKNIDEAATYLIEKMDEAGLIKDKEVRISVADKKTGKRIYEKQRHAFEVVNNLFQNKNKDVSARILTDKEIDDIEDYYENNNVGQYEIDMIKEFKKNLIVAINEKIGKIESLLGMLDKEGLSESEREVGTLNGNEEEKEVLKEIEAYCKAYKADIDDVLDEEIKEYYKDLEKNKEKLQKSLKKINENDDDDDYGDILAELLEIVKERLFEEDD